MEFEIFKQFTITILPLKSFRLKSRSRSDSNLVKVSEIFFTELSAILRILSFLSNFTADMGKLGKVKWIDHEGCGSNRNLKNVS